VLPPGSRGELVLTSLTKEALPVIRYRTHDLTELLPPSARSMRRMARITGRCDDMLIIRGVNLFPSQVEALLLKLAGLAPHYQLELTREGHLDQVTVQVECQGSVAGDAGQRAQLARALAGSIKDHIGISARCVVCDPGTLERSVGKARRVIDHRQAR
jgi:phenylacetate-CoA ligase